MLYPTRHKAVEDNRSPRLLARIIAPKSDRAKIIYFAKTGRT